MNVKFNFDNFFNWYKNNLKVIYTYDKMIHVKWYQKNSTGNYVEATDFLNKKLSFIENKDIYVKIVNYGYYNKNPRIFFIFQDKESNENWGHHYTFVNDNDTIIFHKTNEHDIKPGDIKQAIHCHFHNHQIIPQPNKYKFELSIDNIQCINELPKTVTFKDKFDENERNLIKKIMIAPFKFPIINDNIDNKSIKEDLTTYDAGGSKEKTKKLKHKHICNLLDKCDDISVIIIKKKNVWHYTVTLIKNNDELTFNFNSKEINGTNHNSRINNFIKKHVNL